MEMRVRRIANTILLLSGNAVYSKDFSSWHYVTRLLQEFIIAMYYYFSATVVTKANI